MKDKERIILLDQEALVTGGDGADFKIELANMVHNISQATVHGMDAEPLPDHLRWRITCGQLTICIVEFPPQLHNFKWLAANSPHPYGSAATYEPRSLALPFVVMKVPFLKDKFAGRAELFYRNAPLSKLTDELYWSNLFNVSPHSYNCTAWFCTQNLGSVRSKAGITGCLHGIASHWIGGGFNQSSDIHEKNSGFAKAKKDGLDARVTNVERWEKESLQDPCFVLDIPWKSVGFTVGQLLQNELAFYGCQRNLASVPELINVLLPNRNGKKKEEAAL